MKWPSKQPMENYIWHLLLIPGVSWILEQAQVFGGTVTALISRPADIRPGIWSIEMGDMFPDSEIIGNDFSPVQPNMIPRNVKFEVDDVEAPWTHQEKFDYIHCRFMAGSITDWPKLVRTCYDNLHPGAIAEFQDGDFRIYSEDGSYKGSWFEKWNQDFEKAGELVGRSIRPGPYFKDWMTEVGFEDIHEEKTRIPVGVWAKDKHMVSNTPNYPLKIAGSAPAEKLRMHIEGNWGFQPSANERGPGRLLNGIVYSQSGLVCGGGTGPTE